MKKILLILLFILIIPNVWALKGVGLKWYTEAVQISEGETKCVEYGVYNPWDEDVNTGLIASGEIVQFAKLPNPELVPAGTLNTKALPMQICFKIPRVYDKNCKLGSFVCEHDCSQGIVYSGEVSAVEIASKGAAGGTGSATAASIATDLNISVACKEKKLSWLIIPAAIALAIIGLLSFLGRPLSKKRKEKYMSLFNELEVLRAELEAEPHHEGKRKKYESLWKKLEKIRKKL